MSNILEAFYTHKTYVISLYPDPLIILKLNKFLTKRGAYSQLLQMGEGLVTCTYFDHNMYKTLTVTTSSLNCYSFTAVHGH